MSGLKLPLSADFLPPPWHILGISNDTRPDAARLGCRFLPGALAQEKCSESRPDTKDFSLGVRCDRGSALLSSRKLSFPAPPAQSDGTPRKLLDFSKLTALGWRPPIPSKQVIRQIDEWYRESVVGTRQPRTRYSAGEGGVESRRAESSDHRTQPWHNGEVCERVTPPH
jgi:hypothetical protein